MGSHNLHTKKKKVIADLVKGRETAIQLQTLLQKPPPPPAAASASAGQLLHQILKTFSKSITDLTSTDVASTQIPAGTVDFGAMTKKSPPAGVKNRRGCYKRRRTSDSWTVESSTTEDGFAWRKYGQKAIMNSNFPRCYYRCTHKYDTGCKATKQVQKIKVGKPTFFQTTYSNHHTCIKASSSANKADNDSHLIKFYPSNSVESNNFMSFQTKQDGGVDNITVDSAVKVEQQSSTTTNHDQSEEVVSDAKSTTLMQEDEQRAGIEYQPELEDMGWGHESTSLHCGMEVDQFGDVDDNDIASFFSFDDNM